MFLGREQELQELQRLYQRDDFQLFILYGRRRVGKTTLLNEFCKDKPAIFYSAEQTNDTMNLQKFSKLVLEYYGEEYLDSFASWESALRYINEKQKNKRFILIFDEFPYLANCNQGLMSVLQHLIDHVLKESKLFLILCGSYIGFMEKEVLGAKSPLFGRRTAQLHMRPLNYIASAAFLEGFSVEEKLLLYSIYGGTPLYLRQVDSRQSLKDNIIESFLKPTGYLYEEPLLLLRQELQEPGVYFAVAEAIARGAVRSNEIAGKTGEEAAKCIKYMGILRELGIVYKELPLGAKESCRSTQYGICDPMFMFWYRYVSSNRTLLETGGYEAVWERRIKPDLNRYMGHMFERICQEYLLKKNSMGQLPLLFTEIGRWWGTDSKKREEVEIDIVARDGGEYLFGECKWRNERTDSKVLHSLREKAEVFPRNKERVYYVLFSKSGFTEALLQEAEREKNIMLITLENMMNMD